MSDVIEALVGAVADACERHPMPDALMDGDWNSPLWKALDQIGITLLPVAEDQGGAGGDVRTTVAVLQELGRHSAAVPFAETALQAAWLLAESNASIPAGPMAAVVGGADVSLVQDQGGWELHGTLARVPWARHAEHLVVLVGRVVAVLRRDEFDVRVGGNLAAEPRDDVVIDHLVIPSDRIHVLPEQSTLTEEDFVARGAVARMALTTGAARRAVELSLTYASERHQFGRSLFQFQSVQHQLAAMASETLLCKVAVESAAEVLDDGSPSALPIAAAKSASAHAAGEVARLAHQVHGAIGFTDEHDLRLNTTRIWSWREEFGAERDSSAQVGSLALAAGPDGLWSLITGASWSDNSK